MGNGETIYGGTSTINLDVSYVIDPIAPTPCDAAPSITSVVRDNANTGTISWEPVRGAIEYEIITNGVKYTTVETGFSWSNLISSEAREIQVRTIGYKCKSSWVSTTIPAFSFPCQFTPNLTPTRTNGTEGSISWVAVTGATGYEIIADGITYTTLETSYSWNDLISSEAKSVQVRILGNKCKSSWVSTTIPPFSFP